MNSVKFDLSEAFQQHQEHPQIPIWFLISMLFNFHWENCSLINSFHTVFQTKLVHPCSFGEPLKDTKCNTKHEAPWFGRSRYDKEKKKKTRGVVHYGLAIDIKKYLKVKEELWKFKYFTMQKYNLQKLLLKKKPKIFQDSITLWLISSFNTSHDIIFQKSPYQNRPIT